MCQHESVFLAGSGGGRQARGRGGGGTVGRALAGEGRRLGALYRIISAMILRMEARISSIEGS